MTQRDRAFLQRIRGTEHGRGCASHFEQGAKAALGRRRLRRRAPDRV